MENFSSLRFAIYLTDVVTRDSEATIDNLLTSFQTGKVASNDSASIAPLEALLHEVIILGNQIKRTYFQAETEQILSAPSKATLQDLVNCGPQTVPELARLRSSSRQNMQVIVNRLERLGHVNTRMNPSHKKADLVAITAAGLTLLEETERAQLQLVERLRPELTNHEIERVLRNLRTLRFALGGSGGMRANGKDRRVERDAQSDERMNTASAVQEAPPPEVITEEENSLPYNLL